MGFRDGKVPDKNSTQGKKLEKIVSHNPFLKKMRAKSRGEKYSEIVSGDNSQEYKDNYDKIDWGTRDETPKKYRVKVNGVYVDNEQKDD